MVAREKLRLQPSSHLLREVLLQILEVARGKVLELGGGWVLERSSQFFHRLLLLEGTLVVEVDQKVELVAVEVEVLAVELQRGVQQASRRLRKLVGLPLGDHCVGVGPLSHPLWHLHHTVLPQLEALILLRLLVHLEGFFNHIWQSRKRGKGLRKVSLFLGKLGLLH